MDDSRVKITKDFERLDTLLLNLGLCGRDAASGLSSLEIKTVQEAGTFKLPLSYVMFLERMGKGAGRFFLGTDIYFPSMLPMTDSLRELFEISKKECGAAIEPPSEYFAFSMHQGYQGFFFDAKDQQLDNPPVYHYMEGEDSTKVWSKTFTEFLIYMSEVSW